MANELRGIDYAHSEEKRQFDRYAVRYARPFAIAAKYAIAATSRQNPVFMQERVGQDGIRFSTYKLRTLGSDNLTPTNAMTAVMRRTGFDELIQYKNILVGDMSMVGHRPLTPNEYEVAFDDVPTAIVDRYLATVVPTRPGLVGSFVISSHLGEIEDHAMRLKRLEMDIQDVVDGSYTRDKELFWGVIGKSFGNKMKKGDIRPIEAT